MLVNSNGTTLEILFGSPLGLQGSTIPSNYQVLVGEPGAVPVGVQSVTPLYTEYQSGVGFVGHSDDGALRGSATFRAEADYLTPGFQVRAAMRGQATLTASPAYVQTVRTRRFTPTGVYAPISTGDYISLQSAANNIAFARVLDVHPDGTLILDRDLLAVDPDNGSIAWTHTSALEGVSLEINKPTNGKLYTATVHGLQDTLGAPYEDSQDFTAVSAKPQVVEAVQLAEGQLLITFSDTMRVDFALLSPNEYEVTGPSMVLVKTVQTVTPQQVMLTTVGMGTGAYQVTVNATGTPHDVAGNPMDPVFNMAIFTGSPALASRSVYVDKGPITKPTLVIQTGAAGPGAPIIGQTGLSASISGFGSGVATVTGLSGMTSGSVGHLLVLSGAASAGNNGTFLIKSYVSASSVTVYNSSGVAPDVNDGSITWTEHLASGTINSPTQLTLPTANITAAHVGLYLTLTGSTVNDGTFKITQRVSATVVKVTASFSLPDPVNGTIGWQLQDPRNGEIADNPTDVVVRVNAVPVIPDAVIGLLGQIVLPMVPSPTDTVDVDYCWVCNPVVDFRRLNSQEFRLNNWNRDNGRPADSSRHKYRYNNTLIQTDTFLSLSPEELTGTATFPTSVTLNDVNGQFLTTIQTASFVTITSGPNSGTRRQIVTVFSNTMLILDAPILSLTGGTYRIDPVDLRAEVAQPQQRDLKYRAYERAYSVALNDPNLLLLNSPNHRIAFPPMARQLQSTFVNYQATVLPEADPVAPWERHGSGSAVIAGTDLVVVDASSGPSLTGNPIFWSQTIDLTFDHVFAIAWRMMINAVPLPQGVFTGIAAGYSDDEKAVVIGFLDDGGVKKIGVLKAGAGNDPSDITAWTGGLDGSGNPTGVPMDLDWSILRSYRVFRARTGIITFYVDGSITPSLQVVPDDLPYLEELNAPFNELQGSFFGSLSREAENTSTWSFVRYTAIPINPKQTAPSIFVSYEGTTPPESASQPWTPVGFHGTETIIASDFLLLDSTSATDPVLTIQTGSTGTVLDHTTLSLPTASLTSYMVGLSIRLTGTTVNSGVFRITELLSSTIIKVAAILDPFDAANGAIFWEVFNPDVSGLISGDFKGFARIEPLLAESFDTVLDVNVALRTFTHGITPNAVMAAVDDGTRLIQLSLFPDKAAPKFSYGGRSLPNQFAPYLWNQSGGETPTMVGQYLRIADSSTLDGLVYYLDDLALVTSANRVVGSLTDYAIEFRTQVQSYTPDMVGFAGVMSSVYDSSRSVGIMLEDVLGTRYVTLHSDGTPVVGGQFAFDWFDGKFHTYRAVKSTGGNLVTLFIDGIFVGSTLYSNFTVPAPSITGLVSFGSATPLSVQAQSSALWAYANFWRINPDYASAPLDPTSYRRYCGLWKGYDSDQLTGYHLPLRTAGRMAQVAGNVLTDANQNFVASGVLVGDRIVIDSGPNKGAYDVASVAPTILTILGMFPVQPSGVVYRVVFETDWSTPHRYRIVKDPGGGVSVFLDTNPLPLIHADYSAVDLPPSTSGIAWTVSGALPSILWGAFDPTNVSQTSWDYVRFGAVRSVSELGIVPHHQVLNQRNVMASFEHHRTNIPHAHTDFWSESEGIPPQTEPDLLRDPNLVAYTLLNDSTPLVPSTQTYEVRSPTPVLVSTVGLNRPEDVLGSQAFLLNNASQTIQILVPDDVLYNCLQVIESDIGDPNLIFPFDDECQPSFGPLFFQKEVCLTYDGSVLPENDPTAASPWTRVSDDDSHQFASAFSGVLTYGTDATGTRTTYRNNSPLPDSIGLETEVKFRLKLLLDSTGGLGDSQVRVGFSSPGVTVGLAFVTTPLGERYVLAVDLNNGQTLGGIPFDFYDGNYHDYRLVRTPGLDNIRIFIDA